MKPKNLRCKDGTELTYRRFSGEPGAVPLVFSGGLGGTHLVWTALVKNLRRGHDVLVWDYPGLDTGNLPHGAEISVEWLAALQEEIIEAEGIEHPWLVGWSLGPQVAFAHAALYPRRAAGIVAICGTAGSPFLEGNADEPIASALGIRSAVPDAVDWITDRIDRIEKLKSMLSKIEHPARWAKRLGLVDPAADELILDAVVREFIRLDPSIYKKYVRAAAARANPEHLSRLDLPVATFAGQRDRLVPPSMVAELAASIPGAVHTEVRGATHFLPMEYPELLAMKMEDFIRANGGRP